MRTHEWSAEVLARIRGDVERPATARAGPLRPSDGSNRWIFDVSTHNWPSSPAWS